LINPLCSLGIQLWLQIFQVLWLNFFEQSIIWKFNTRSLTLLTMLRSLSEYSFIVFHYFILFISNFHIKFSACIPLNFSFLAYSCFKNSQISLVILSVIIFSNIRLLLLLNFMLPLFVDFDLSNHWIISLDWNSIHTFNKFP